MITPAGLSVVSRDMYEIVRKICNNWNVPQSEWEDFRRITRGALPEGKDFFLRVATRGHYKQALTRILQQMPCP